MIISASRRTDIPTYYSEWFFNRIKERYVLVRNPVNIHQISRIDLNPDVVDGIVFWTKNPTPMLNKLDRLKDYAYYFQFTLNSYGQDIEKSIPSKSNIVIPTFQKLSDMIGPDRVIWRYDPVFLNKKYTIEYHTRYFEELAKRLSPYTKKCVISFLDFYKNTEQNIYNLNIEKLDFETQNLIAKNISEIAHSYGLKLETCAEGIDLKKYGIEHGRCIDDRLFSKLLNVPLEIKKDKNQRLECGCIESIDIGSYNTCKNRCCYCYANYNGNIVNLNTEKHNPNNPLIIGNVGPEDRITNRKMYSYLDDIVLK